MLLCSIDTTDPVLTPIDKFNQSKFSKGTGAPLPSTSLIEPTPKTDSEDFFTPEQPSDECIHCDNDFEETNLL